MKYKHLLYILLLKDITNIYNKRSYLKIRSYLQYNYNKKYLIK